MRKRAGRLERPGGGAGLAALLLGDDASGVALREACHGAGELRLVTVARAVVVDRVELGPVDLFLKRNRMSRTAFSRGLSFKSVSLRMRSSNLSVLSSCSIESSWRIGRHRS